LELKEENVHPYAQKPLGRTREGPVTAPGDLKLREYCHEPEQDGNRTWDF